MLHIYEFCSKAQKFFKGQTKRIFLELHLKNSWEEQFVRLKRPPARGTNPASDVERCQSPEEKQETLYDP